MLKVILLAVALAHTPAEDSARRADSIEVLNMNLGPTTYPGVDKAQRDKLIRKYWWYLHDWDVDEIERVWFKTPTIELIPNELHGLDSLDMYA